LIAQQPAPGANVVNRFVTLSADFSNQVNANSVRVWLDGADITSRCSVSRASVSYRPPAPLAFGGHTMRVAGVDAGGSRFDRSWSFNVSGAAPPPSPIALRAQQPAPGASVANRFATISAEFTNRVVPGSVRVLLDGADRTSQSGISATAFSYKPPAPLGFGSHTVRVTGRGEGGLAFDRSWSFTVAGSSPSITLTIQQPGPNAVVGTSFVVRGKTIANGRVVVTAGAGAPATGQFSGNVTAGGQGNFNMRVSFTRMPGQQVIRVKVTATDPVSGKSTQTVLQLALK
jgi:hypothetical protein